MKPRLIGILLCLVFLGGLVAVLYISGQREPTYGGKPLSRWVRDLKSSDVNEQRAAVAALRQLGSEPLPRLRNMLRARDTAAKRLAARWCAKVSFLKIRFVPACKQHKIAAEIVSWIGSPEVIPDLTSLLDDTNCAHASAQALTRLTPASGPALLKALTNQVFEVRWMAAANLSAAPGDLVVSNLVAALREPSGVSMVAAVSLGEIGRRPELVVPALCDYLQRDPDLSHCISAIHAIAKFGGKAHRAITTLELFRNHTNQVVANAATQALARIREGQ